MTDISQRRTVTLSDDVRQEHPLAFLVFAHDDDPDYQLFIIEKDAIDFAQEQEEKSDAAEGSWLIYPLWASDQLSRE